MSRSTTIKRSYPYPWQKIERFEVSILPSYDPKSYAKWSQLFLSLCAHEVHHICSRIEEKPDQASDPFGFSCFEKRNESLYRQIFCYLSSKEDKNGIAVLTADIIAGHDGIGAWNALKNHHNQKTTQSRSTQFEMLLVSRRSHRKLFCLSKCAWRKHLTGWTCSR